MWARHHLCARLLPLLVLLLPVLPAAVAAQVLGRIEDDYEPHSDLMLVSGELAGFSEACGFGRRPDRDEMLDWYRRHDLARSGQRIQAIFDLGVTLGQDSPCTVDENIRLVRRWEALMQRTEAYVRDYRSPGVAPGVPGDRAFGSSR
jgi:hypothetical protein